MSGSRRSQGGTSPSASPEHVTCGGTSLAMSPPSQHVTVTLLHVTNTVSILFCRCKIACLNKNHITARIKKGLGFYFLHHQMHDIKTKKKFLKLFFFLLMCDPKLRRVKSLEF